MVTSGRLETASGITISYINQNTSHLSGSLKEYAEKHGLDYSLFLTLLRKLDMNRIQFEKNIEEYSEGQKKKVLIAASLLTSAHLYIWDEPLNYIDVFSRMQIEKLIEAYKPTMIVVEHDVRFREKLATKVLDM
jgi:lincosamide and streptogramin A transport system ATP-binding/permease protein